MINAEELRKLRDEAEALARMDGTNSLWKRAYEQLADACDRLIMLNERCLVKEG